VNILGISCFYHDAAAALLQDGQLIAAAEEERFTRKKHDSDFPRRAIEFCLKKGGIAAGDLDYVVFYEKPFVKFQRILMSALQTFPRSFGVFQRAMLNWLGEKLWMRDVIERQLRIAPDKILFSEHHLSHAASAFFCSPYQDAAILTVDGVGEWATATLGVGRGTEIKLYKEVRFPHSLGLLYSAFTAFLGFEVNEGEYKVMGMAPYGEARYVDEVWKLVRVGQDGSFWLDMDYFAYHHSATRSFNSKFEGIFGTPRDPAAPFFTSRTGYPSYYGERPANFAGLAADNQRYADIAASVQVVVEEILLRMVNALHRETGLTNLCMAGGVALNSVANGRILREGPFTSLYIHPAAGDGGGAIGAALYAHHTLLAQPRGFVLRHAYWGEEESDGAIRSFLDTHSIPYEHVEDEDKLLDRVVDGLVSGAVTGWFQGRFEWGPRALGNRSILADPRRADMKDIVNVKIKFREPFRPFAPAILAERTQEYFEAYPREDWTDPSARNYPGTFMLLVFPIKPDKHAAIPAVTHVDGSGRLQTVYRDTNPLYYRLIEKFGEATTVPVVLNTSFNLKGEPIVTSIQDAYNTFSKSGMDTLVAGRFIVPKER
jgi:carbamoyltransferase